MLRGQKKTNYMRHYMRKRRLKGRLLDPAVRPICPPELCSISEVKHCPCIDADGNPIYED